ncbi:pancreatic progenitor cell differentiation and proliferation factor-like protein isoform X1 [Passer domesticus]|uniref:pancreatic progenitor cell differentiation and proliferation factor-like protein isoform X1 n=1 Tax=Passer domesticus TaxID=48849 RepID=UPI0030FE32C7
MRVEVIPLASLKKFVYLHSHVRVSEQKSLPKQTSPRSSHSIGKRTINAAAPSPHCRDALGQERGPRGQERGPRGPLPGRGHGRGLSRADPSGAWRPWPRAPSPAVPSLPSRPCHRPRAGGAACRSHKGRPQPRRASLRSGVALGLCKAARPGTRRLLPEKGGFPVCRCHGLRPVRRLPPGQEPVLPELNSESSVSSSSSCCLDAVNITDQDKALHGLPELIDKHWWIKSFFHSEPSPPTVGRKTLSASSTNS